MSYKKNVEVIEHQYECDVCGSINEATSDLSKDRPQGYYVHVRRVTDHLKHRISDELFFCSKECFEEFVRYRISDLTVNWKSP